MSAEPGELRAGAVDESAWPAKLGRDKKKWVAVVGERERVSKVYACYANFSELTFSSSDGAMEKEETAALKCLDLLAQFNLFNNISFLCTFCTCRKIHLNHGK